MESPTEPRQEHADLSIVIQEDASENLHRYQDLFNNVPAAYLQTNRFGVILEANRAATDLLGHPATSMRGRPLGGFVVEADRRKFRRILFVAAEGTDLGGFEVRIQPQNRSFFFASLDVRAVSNHDGNVSDLYWIIRDLTRLKMDRALLRDNEASLRLIMEQLPATIWTTDAALNVTSLEGSALPLHESHESAEEELGELLTASDSDNPASAAHHRALEGKAGSFEFARGEHIFACSVQPLRVGESIEGCVGIAFDVTDERRMREALEKALDGERLALEVLLRMDRMKNLLMETLSHDLRNPLASVLGFAHTLLINPDLDANMIHEAASRIEANAQVMAKMIGDLLDLDRLNQKMLQPQRSKIDVAELTRLVSSRLELDRDAIVVEPGRLITNIDPEKTERILENLLVDAKKHSPPGVPVWVRLIAQPRDGVLIVVDDAGPGVPDELKESIFEPYERGAERRSPGMGLGLSIVAGFAALHDGRAWVEDRAGGGSSFKVLLNGPVES